MDLAVPSAFALVRASPAAAAPPAEALTAARGGSIAPGLQVTALAEPDRVGQDRGRASAGEQEEEPDPMASLRPVAFLPDELGNHYRYKLAHEPDFDRPLLQIVDEKTDRILVSLPPEQLVRMLEDTKAMIEQRLQHSHAKHLDTTA